MKKHKPTSAGRRKSSVIEYRKILTGSTPHKKLTFGKKRSVGRNSQGRITSRHKGGGHKRAHRAVDFLYLKRNIPARIETIEYDPNRTSFISLICFDDGSRRYIVTPQGVKTGDKIIFSEEADIRAGNRLPLYKVPVGTSVYHIELQPNGGAKMGRSAGVGIQITAHDTTDNKTTLKMPSGEVRKVPSSCWASVGEISNPEHQFRRLGKAGRSRHMGVRPTVRGSAMSPVDHPHGGGEGRQGIGLRRGPKTREGKQAYGVRTRRPKKYSNKAIVSRRKTKRNVKK